MTSYGRGVVYHPKHLRDECGLGMSQSCKMAMLTWSHLTYHS